MLEENEILDNKKRFIDLLHEIKREGADIEGLINKLENSDFFIAPASTQYHCAYKGGLCEHSLHVYEQLNKLCDIEYDRFINGDPISIDATKVKPTNDSILIVSLLHDFSKMNFYVTDFRNVKDEKGNWTRVPYIKVKEASERFLFGNHEMNSLYMIESFIPLSVEEATAVLHHMGGKSFDSAQDDITAIYNKYSLACLLHTADMLATYIDERN